MSDTTDPQPETPTPSASEEAVSQEDTRIALPDDLPPVEPPSAGMIIQLFLVPAIIVAVIVGVYAAFGQLASQELDWRQLITDVRSENPHVKWRGALSLAHMLNADAQRGEESQNLKANPEIAAALSELYSEYTGLDNLTEEELQNLEFLSKALGRMQVQDPIIPVLREGMQESKNRDVRKHSLIGLSLLAGNLKDAGQELEDQELVEELIEISKESDRLFRHQGAYALGLFPTEKSLNRLKALIHDSDLMTRVNAAIGLARNNSTEGVDVFFDMLKDANDWELDPTQVKTEEEQSQYFERVLMLLNGMKALDDLKDQLSPDQSELLIKSLDKLDGNIKDAVLKNQLIQLKSSL